MGSFSTALSALDATNTAIDVVGNNLANLNTTGFKDSTVSFQDLVTQAAGGGPSGNTQVGFGVAPPVTIQQFTQGSIQTASGSLDSAIQGNGFFIVNDASSGATLYTRDGTFQTDAEGNLLTTSGQYVQGWMASNGQVDTNAPVGNIQVQTGEIRPPVATANIAVDMNLDVAPPAGSTTGSFSTSLQTIDSLGNPMVLTMNFTQSATNPLQWNYQITVPGNATTGGTPGTPTDLLATPGTLTFNSSGELITPAATAGPVALSITGLSDGAADMNINWNLYNSSGNPTISEYAEASAVSGNSQDGTAAAQLVSVAMSSGGQIMGTYSDGTEQVVAQVAVAGIRNPDSLAAVGNNDYQATAQTALPAVGTANTGGRGQIVGGSLEASTSDIATELTNLIVLQSAYEANAKVVTTVDQLTQTTVNLKQ